MKHRFSYGHPYYVLVFEFELRMASKKYMNNSESLRKIKKTKKQQYDRRIDNIFDSKIPIKLKYILPSTEKTELMKTIILVVSYE